MPKHSVPKKKVSQARTARRYASFVHKKYKKIRAIVGLTKCPSCGAPRILHHACPNCGNYRGKPILAMDKKISKITKVKA